MHRKQNCFPQDVFINYSLPQMVQLEPFSGQGENMSNRREAVFVINDWLHMWMTAWFSSSIIGILLTC